MSTNESGDGFLRLSEKQLPLVIEFENRWGKLLRFLLRRGGKSGGILLNKLEEPAVRNPQR